MKAKFKPGELWAKHQEKMKKKHEKHKKTMAGDQPSMANWKPVQGGFGYPKPAKSLTPKPMKLPGMKTPQMGGMLKSSMPKLAKKKHSKHRKHKKAIKTTGKFEGKSNALGHGGRAAQLKAQGVPGGVIGNLARAAHAAPGQANFHGKHKKHEKKHEKHHKMGKHCKTCSCD